jgi:hypothetical protein
LTAAFVAPALAATIFAAFNFLLFGAFYFGTLCVCFACPLLLAFRFSSSFGVERI